MTRFALAAVLMLAAPAMAQTPPSFQHPDPAPPLAAAGGRYVLGSLQGILGRTTYLLDTQTGRVWMLIDAAATDGKGMFLVPAQFMDGGKTSFTPPRP